MILDGVGDMVDEVDHDVERIVALSTVNPATYDNPPALIACVYDVTASVGRTLARLEKIRGITAELHARLRQICDDLDTLKSGRPC